MYSDQIVQGERAAPTQLLKRCKELRSIPDRQVLNYAEQWFPITEALGLGAASYLAVIVREIRVADGRQRETLEKILRHAAAISSDDLGLLRGATGGETVGPIHFRLFEQMCRKLGRVANAQNLLPETVRLRDAIRNLFDTFAGGIAAFRVIELIAYSVVEHQLPLFLAAERSEIKLYTRDKLDYIRLHLQIEGKHAAESDELVGLLHESGGDMPVFEEHVEYLASMFEAYLRALEVHVLG